MRSKASILISVLLLLLITVGALYWYLVFRVPKSNVSVVPGNQTTQTGFQPLNTDTPPGGNTENNSSNSNSSSTINNVLEVNRLRILSNTPVGGYGIQTNINIKSGQVGSTTIRFVDRGRGNVYEAYGENGAINTISNTLVPRIYSTLWNKELSSFLAQYSNVNNDSVTTVITSIIKNDQLKKISTSTAANDISQTPYQLRGTLISGQVIASAVSPAKDRFLIVSNINGRAVGYISKFDGTGQIQIFSVPFTQIIVDWPETNTITLTTKAGNSYAGYFYFINAKTGAMKLVLGGLPGLSAKANKDASKVIYSVSGRNSDLIETRMLDLKSGQTGNVVFSTLSDKCVWSSKNIDYVYCAVPSDIFDAEYPDDWYMGKVSFTDSIWMLNSKTGLATQIVDPLISERVLIDATNLQIDEADKYLLFTNKNNLFLWLLSIDIPSSNN